ncbi:ribosome biogenesis protein SLX9-domain-containing protein [Lasiosphaeria miniovina]|uniref:Ribosome biogenesis protein SLX9 n=1 Tax=Lasiosphaeria miniovina TaxID=1954250 RepID=A0AA40BHY2_9PEZI|nr:ribosome biogenesis protein SLX9-domain-containing protein [Lasiosphaeria miniovina]KAK0734504.1 ribosome biogenesis protein SLX9-domain-containing protein [Lasiosphaeria miniovina]
MAPTAPTAAAKKRVSARSKAQAAARSPTSAPATNTASTSSFRASVFSNSRRDKQIVKHSSFVSRIAKTPPQTHNGSSIKRRRPSKKLVATLESLGDALDDITAGIAADDADAMDPEQARQGKVRHKSLRSRPGALKRKEKVVRGEMERFGRSLAQLTALAEVKAAAPAASASSAITEDMDTDVAAGAGAAAVAPVTASRWAALRGFISATMEQNPSFLGHK